MVLTSSQITSKGIVSGAIPVGQRATTYDATVGSIILCGVEIDDQSFMLPPRGIVWVVSAEAFSLPSTVTGLATLKTQWTHQGVLALNVGVVDPGWEGPLSAAVVNFSNSDFVIKKGDPFFRILFHSHRAAGTAFKVDRPQYLKQVKDQSRAFSKTFLSMDSLTKEVADEVLRLPKWAYYLSLLGMIIAVAAVFAPIALTLWMDFRGDPVRLAVVEKKLEELEAKDATISVQPSQKFDFKRCVVQSKGNGLQAVCDVTPVAK